MFHAFDQHMFISYLIRVSDIPQRLEWFHFINYKAANNLLSLDLAIYLSMNSIDRNRYYLQRGESKLIS